jgi:hypothetical protein
MQTTTNPKIKDTMILLFVTEDNPNMDPIIRLVRLLPKFKTSSICALTIEEMEISNSKALLMLRRVFSIF